MWLSLLSGIFKLQRRRITLQTVFLTARFSIRFEEDNCQRIVVLLEFAENYAEIVLERERERKRVCKANLHESHCVFEPGAVTLLLLPLLTVRGNEKPQVDGSGSEFIETQMKELFASIVIPSFSKDDN